MALMTEQERYKLFVDCCKHWIDKLSMHDVEFFFLMVDDLESACAAATYKLDAHHAFMQLSSDEDDPEMIRDAALHEVLEVFLMPMKIQAINQEDVFHPYVQRETHAVIHILERVLHGT